MLRNGVIGINEISDVVEHTVGIVGSHRDFVASTGPNRMKIVPRGGDITKIQYMPRPITLVDSSPESVKYIHNDITYEIFFKARS